MFLTRSLVNLCVFCGRLTKFAYFSRSFVEILVFLRNSRVFRDFCRNLRIFVSFWWNSRSQRGSLTCFTFSAPYWRTLHSFLRLLNGICFFEILCQSSRFFCGPNDRHNFSWSYVEICIFRGFLMKFACYLWYLVEIWVFSAVIRRNSYFLRDHLTKFDFLSAIHRWNSRFFLWNFAFFSVAFWRNVSFAIFCRNLHIPVAFL